jgi:hypothetical protein
MSRSRTFDDPIRDGGALKALRDAGHWAMALLKAEQHKPH